MPYSLSVETTGMDITSASYKYLRKSPCEAKAFFFGYPSSVNTNFLVNYAT
jgi:hypothetical protein